MKTCLMTHRMLCLAAAVAAACTAIPSATAGEPPKVAVLDTASFWRSFGVIRTPARRKDGKVEPFRIRQGANPGHGQWLEYETPLPHQGWQAPDFDDATWTRTPGRPLGLSPFLALICSRGKFQVTDAAKVKDLTLSARYTGGIVVYVNGQEIARGHLPKDGAIGSDDGDAGVGLSAQFLCEPVEGRAEFCDADCREDYEARDAAMQRAGR